MRKKSLFTTQRERDREIEIERERKYTIYIFLFFFLIFFFFFSISTLLQMKIYASFYHSFFAVFFSSSNICILRHYRPPTRTRFYLNFYLYFQILFSYISDLHKNLFGQTKFTLRKKRKKVKSRQKTG